jgi:hypothetical protein
LVLACRDPSPLPIEAAFCDSSMSQNAVGSSQLKLAGIFPMLRFGEMEPFQPYFQPDD